MAMVVKNNMSAISTLNTLNTNQSRLAKSLAQVSSGQRINSAQDDASGYAISERMRVMTRSLDQANDNTQNGSSLMKVAEGAVGKTVEILRTLKEKAIAAATDTKTDEDRATIQKEINQLVDQIDDNALVTFNGKYLIDGSKSAAGDATYSTWTNQALSEDTSALTKLTEMKARDGEALTIESTDKVTVSYVQNGRTYTTTALVGDKTLGNIFKLAEDIDQSTQTFATSQNEAISAASGLITTPTSKDTVDKAIAYLQDALSYNSNKYNSPGYLDGEGNSSVGLIDSSTDGDFNGSRFLNIAIQNEEGKLDYAQIVTSDATTTSLTSAIDSAVGMGTTYNGEIFAKVDAALYKYNSLVGEIGNSDSGIAKLLQTQLKTSGIEIDWDSGLGNIYNYKSQIYASGDEALIGYYEQYTSAVAAKGNAKEELEAAINEYNEGLAQLDALVKLQALETDKLSYQSAVDSFINALRTEMKASQNGTYTLAAGSAGNQKQLSFDSGNGSLSEAERVSAVENIVSALKDQLYKYADEAMLDLATLSESSETFASKVTALIGDGTEPASDGIKFSATTNPDTTFSKVLCQDGSGAAASSAETSFLKAINSAIEKMGTSAGNFKQETDTNTRLYLDLAQNDVLAQYSGPAITTGSVVGLDPAGKKVETLDGKVGLSFMAATAGTQGQISGFSISISDSEGNVRKSVNTSLNAWKTTIYAKNASEKDNSLVFHVGASANQSIAVDMADMRAEALGLKGKDGKVVDVSTKENANAAISVFETALQKALDVQTTIGAIEARLTYTSDNLTTASENVTAAESTIRDADMAKAMTEYTKNNVLLQAAQSMLAQANQNSSAVLSLLQ